MARIRSIKPEITQDAKLATVSRETRYHFVLLLTAADDEGCFRANARLLLGQLYPHDEDVSAFDVERMNADLERIGVLDLVHTPDGPLGSVRNWKKHQKIDRPSKSHLATKFEQFATVSREAREGASTGVLSPESLPAVVTDEDLAVAASVGVREPDLTALYLAICANQAVAERWGEQIHPYTQGSAASLYDALRSAGVPPEVARLALYRQCRESPSKTPPRSINYFRPGIIEAWEVEKVRLAGLEQGNTAPPVQPSGASAATTPATGARRESWKDADERREREEGQRRLIRDRNGNIDQRRALEDGPAWWVRIQREAKAAGIHPVLYGYDHLKEPAVLEGHAHV